MRKITRLLGAFAISASFMRSIAAHAHEAQIERGGHLVELSGSTDRHTPGYVFGKAAISLAPMSPRMWSGSAHFVEPRLTPDDVAALWS